MTVLGAILAGGQATRFGSDKALALLDGQTLIAHAAAALRAATDAVIVCGRAAGPEGIAAVPDWPAPDLGPLGGLCAALRHAEAHGHDGVLSIGCDTPFLPSELVERLVAGGEARFLRQAPIIGYWPVALAEGLSQHLAQGADRAVYRWASRAGAVAIDAGGDLPNINHVADLARLADRAE
ncbi:molybdenum cofactor guanylyltransferase [Sphingomonas glacialis]|uniref:Molybdenum cofactor guanylyltransferase n=1 Tax=Sphingomonas glacialis TaxID=658225 RepID=A0A502G006_9SPHN|nr:molybdenum cofactor guanylyltransferase [Sphingomonas glacialis]TPG54463.1 molybdenum cofactor guanylyltransferase [Sphingomonas glacialis]